MWRSTKAWSKQGLYLLPRGPWVQAHATFQQVSYPRPLPPSETLLLWSHVTKGLLGPFPHLKADSSFLHPETTPPMFCT